MGDQNPPLWADFLVAAYNTAQQMIRSSNNRVTFVFLFFGINLSIFGIRGDRILVILRGRGEAWGFLAPFVLLFLLSFWPWYALLPGSTRSG